MRLPALLAALLAALAITLLAACGGGGDGGEGTAAETDDFSPQALDPGPNAAVQPVIAVDPLTVGTNRIAFGLFDRDGGLVPDATVSARFFMLDDDGNGRVTGSFDSEQSLTAVRLPQDYAHLHLDGTTHQHSGPNTTVYAGNVDFGRPEWWGAELAVTVDGEQLDPLKVKFWVMPDAPEPALGASIPASVQLTTNDTSDITLIDSSDPPHPDLHDVTIAAALEQGRPIVIAFATPAFCQTRFCGPVVEGVVVPLAAQYGDRAEFIHVEPFDIPEARAGRLVEMPVMAEWGLTSEPWVFLIDAEGRVAGKFQGITSADEVGAALERVLAE
jgi:hypothetical protein